MTSRFIVTLPSQVDEDLAARSMAEHISKIIPKSVRSDLTVTPVPETAPVVDKLALLNIRRSIRDLRREADRHDAYGDILNSMRAELDRTAALHREMVLEQLGLLDPALIAPFDPETLEVAQ